MFLNALPLFHKHGPVTRNGFPIYCRLETDNTTRQFFILRDGKLYPVNNPPLDWLTVKIQKQTHQLNP